jgi:uncharacterized membrane protein
MHGNVDAIDGVPLLRKLIEPLIGSLGIWAAGIVTLPFTSGLAGGSVTHAQALKMGGMLFVMRLVWLSVLRLFFARRQHD